MHIIHWYGKHPLPWNIDNAKRDVLHLSMQVRSSPDRIGTMLVSCRCDSLPHPRGMLGTVDAWHESRVAHHFISTRLSLRSRTDPLPLEHECWTWTACCLDANAEPCGRPPALIPIEACSERDFLLHQLIKQSGEMRLQAREKGRSVKATVCRSLCVDLQR